MASVVFAVNTYFFCLESDTDSDVEDSKKVKLFNY